MLPDDFHSLIFCTNLARQFCLPDEMHNVERASVALRPLKLGHVDPVEDLDPTAADALEKFCDELEAWIEENPDTPGRERLDALANEIWSILGIQVEEKGCSHHGWKWMGREQMWKCRECGEQRKSVDGVAA